MLACTGSSNYELLCIEADGAWCIGVAAAPGSEISKPIGGGAAAHHIGGGAYNGGRAYYIIHYRAAGLCYRLSVKVIQLGIGIYLSVFL